MPYILRHYQRDARDAVLNAWMEYDRVLASSPVGSGKTVIVSDIILSLMIHSGRVLLIADQDELVFQPARAIKEHTGVIPAIEKADARAGLRNRVVIGSVQTLSKKNRLEQFPEDFFSHVLIDECFPSGTMIGNRPIETLLLGDVVDSFDADTLTIVKRRVVEIFKSKPKALVRLSVMGKSVICTPGHPFFTPHGWIPAVFLTNQSVLRYGRQMPSLRKDIHSFSNAEMVSDVWGDDSLVLLKGMPKYKFWGISQACSNISEVRRVRKALPVIEEPSSYTEFRATECMLAEMPGCILLRKEKTIQSHAGSRGREKESLKHDEATWSWFRYSGRKWLRAHHAGAVIVPGAGASCEFHIENESEEGEWNSNALQDRYRRPIDKTCHRNRRKISWYDGKENNGREKDEVFEWVRVDSVEILEPASDGRFGGMCPDGFVYNIEVEGTHSYIASGLVVHNCHRDIKRKIAICDYFKRAQVAGVTATPYLSDLRDLSKWFETVAYQLPILDLIEHGFAPQIKVLSLPVEIDLGDVETSISKDGRDYKAEGLETAIAPYFHKIADLVKEHAPSGHIIAFLPLKKSAEEFAAICRDHGITAQYVAGDSPDRSEIIEGFSRGEFQLLANAALLTTGVDIPIADTFLNLTPTRSIVRYRQSFGRAMRVLPGVVDDLPESNQAEERKQRISESAKPHTLILDLLWQDEEMGVMRPGHLVVQDPADAQRIYEKSKKQLSEQDLLEIAKRVQEEKEQRLIHSLEVAATRQRGATIMADHVAGLLGSAKLAKYEPIARWELDRPTSKQLEQLMRYGINPESIKTKGHASQLIETMIYRFRFHLATLKQVRYARTLGIADPERMTMQEISREIDEAKRSALPFADYSR